MNNKEERLLDYSMSRFRHTVRLLKNDELGLKGKKINFAEYMSLESSEAKKFLSQRLQNLISGLTILDGENEYGVYNRHDFAHTESVHRITHTLLDTFEVQNEYIFTNEERNIATAICYLHDIGNKCYL